MPVHLFDRPAVFFDFGDGLMDWLWPSRRNQSNSVLVRFGRVLHWAMVVCAALGAVISFFGIWAAQGGELTTYVSVTVVWVSIAMLGRGFRYILAKE